MFSELEDSLMNLENVIQIFWRNITTQNRKNVSNAIINFDQALNNNAEIIDGFLTCYSSKLLSIYLLFKDRNLIGDSIRKDIINLYNKFYIDTTSTITKLFNESIKGITYFHDQVNFMVTNKPVPLYHRTTCCGPREGPIQNIERCYIERKLYDEIYKKFGIHFPKQMSDNDYFEPSQNIGHINFLSVMEQLLKTTFPNIDNIDVIVNDNEDFHIPITFTIIKKYTNGTKIEEKYIKTYRINKLGNQLYENEVKCSKIDTTTNITKYYEKIQNFEKETLWREKVVGGKKSKRNVPFK